MKKIVPVNKIPFADEEEAARAELKKELLTKEIRRMLSGEFDEGMKRSQVRQSDRGMALPTKEEADRIAGLVGRRYKPAKPGYAPEHEYLNRESRISPEEKKYLQHLERMQDLQSPVSRIPNLEDYNPVSGEFGSDVLVKPKPKKFFKSIRGEGRKEEEQPNKIYVVAPPSDTVEEEQKKKIKDKIKKLKKIKSSSYNPEKEDYDYEY